MLALYFLHSLPLLRHWTVVMPRSVKSSIRSGTLPPCPSSSCSDVKRIVRAIHSLDMERIGPVLLSHPWESRSTGSGPVRKFPLLHLRYWRKVACALYWHMAYEKALAIVNFVWLTRKCLGSLRPWEVLVGSLYACHEPALEKLSGLLSTSTVYWLLSRQHSQVSSRRTVYCFSHWSSTCRSTKVCEGCMRNWAFWPCGGVAYIRYSHF